MSANLGVMSVGLESHALPHHPSPAATPNTQKLPDVEVTTVLNDSEDIDDSLQEIEDDEETAPVTSQSATHAARKRKHLALFSLLQENIVRSGSQTTLKTEAEEELSLKAIMAKQQSQRIISSPRDYQMELFERAKTQNTIAVLDTGSGKTLIAVLLLRYIIDHELEDRWKDKNHRISFFLTDKVALAVQQQAVLKANLDQEVDLIYGTMHPELWSKEIWSERLKQHMVIVCTAEILLQSLLRSFVRIEDINLLIFDEAHHAKKGHPYARIIRDAYLCEPDLEKRPRIFGMTASPVDGDLGDDLQDHARELESLLHATIATTSDLKLFRRDFATKPIEHINRFDPLPPPPATKLYQELWAGFWDLHHFKPLFLRAASLTSELGPWCSDLFWSFALSETARAKREEKLDRTRQKRNKEVSSDDAIDAEIARLNNAYNIVREFGVHEPTLCSLDLSPKAMALINQLLLEYERPTDSKCLVFVERKDTARLLFTLSQRLGGNNLKPGMLTGTNSESTDTLRYSAREQALTIMKFRNNELNCLFATSVAEEGIDVPDCNLVIRFDPCKTLIQYIQSRGRARHKNSKFIHFVERYDMLQEATLANIWAGEESLQQLCKNLPEDRKIDHEYDTNINSLTAVNSPRSYTVPSTGAKLTYDFSLVVLANFVSCIPHDEEEDLSLNYVMTTKSGKFVCEVVLPSQSPVHSAIGRPYPKKAFAKRSAAFEACILLKQRNYIDDHLLPTYAKKLPAMRNAHLALNMKSSKSYVMQSKPLVWEQDRGTIPRTLFLNIIALKDQWDRPVQPIGLLSRQKLPILPQFPIFRINGQAVLVHVTRVDKEFAISDARISQITWFSLTMFKDLFNKTFENNPSVMSYWLAPLLPSAVHADSTFDDASKLINWELTEELLMKEPYNWTSEMQSDDLLNKFLIDPWDGGRRLFTKRIAHEYKPSDEVPPDCVPGYQTNTIIDYSVKLFRNSRHKRVWDENQPVIEAEKTMHRLNVLADPSQAEQQALTKCFVCPEPLKISRLPSDLAAMCLLFPAIIHRIESYLIALEFATSLNLDIPPALALEAITKDSENVGDHFAEKVQFQRGMGPNYERLEFLGDCFLKTATSVAVFTRHTGYDEFEMHVDRMCMLCNKNLFNNAKQNEWFKYIRGLSFSRRTWYPHGIKLLEGKGAKTQEQQAPVQQNLGDKTIADVCEAMIGAAFLAHYKDGYSDSSQFDNAVKAVSRFVANEEHEFQKWSEYYEAYALPKYQIADSTASQRDLVKQLMSKHSYAFKYPRLARTAFMHPSQPRMVENLPSYQRLEFLGDSLLDLTAICYLYQKYPTKDPQWLTEHKMAMVSNRFLSALCVKLGFHKHLRHSHAGIEGQIRHFVEDVEEAERNANGAPDFWTTIKDPPKCLSDIVESYIGAIFVDSEYNYAEVQRFFDTHIKWFFEDMSIYDAFANDHPVRKFHTLVGETMCCSYARIITREMPWVNGVSSGVLSGVFVHETTLASHQGTSVRYAKAKAASKALKELEGLAPYEFRQRFGCDCKPLEAGESGETLGDIAGVVA